MVKMENKRNESLDILKGIGIVLMILAHCALPFYLQEFIKLILIFLMPLFFIISGFLYKDRDVSDIYKKRIVKILKPYLFTGFIIWLLKLIQGKYYWGLSILLGNGSRPVFNSSELSDYKIGPLWFLLAYCWALIMLHYLMKVNSDSKKIIIAFIAFELSLVFSHIIGLLPLDIIPAIPAALFMLVGYLYKTSSSIHLEIKPLYFHSIGIILVILCYFFGSMSMASHVYRLNIIQILAAIYITYVLYIFANKDFVIKYLKGWGISLIGKYSLAIMCFHAIDWNLHLTNYIYNSICLNDDLRFISSFLLKYIFAFSITLIAYYTPFVNKLYSLKE